MPKKKLIVASISVAAILGGIYIAGHPYVQGKVFALTRKLNQLHCHDYPAENGGWRKIGGKPVYGDETTGTIFDPYVYYEDSIYVMCASERKTGALIALHSKDGRHWEKASTMLKPIKGTWEDIVNRGCVIKADSMWLLYYTGQSYIANGGQSAIGLAISHDGQDWVRVKNEPILRPEYPFEKESVMNPCVLKDGDTYKMWYSAGETYEPDVICYAESKDGFHFKKRANPVLGKCPDNDYERCKVGGCQVMKGNKGYEIYYIGYQNVDVARICHATSVDGIHWDRGIGGGGKFAHKPIERPLGCRRDLQADHRGQRGLHPAVV